MTTRQWLAGLDLPNPEGENFLNPFFIHHFVSN